MEKLPDVLVDALIADPVTREAIKDVTIELLKLKLDSVETENISLRAQLAAVPVASIRRIFEAASVRGRPLQFDMNVVQKWLESTKEKQL